MFDKINKLIKHNFHPDNIGLTITELVAVLIWMISTLVFYVVLNQTFPDVELFQWNNSLILIASYFIVDGLTFGILYRNLESLAVDIEEKKIDNILLFPVNLKKFLSFRRFQFSSLIQIPISVIAFLFFGDYTLIGLFYWILTLILGFIISYQLWFFIILQSFWFKSENRLTNLFEEISAIGMFPANIYIFTKSFLFFYPFLLLSSLPTYDFVNNTSLNLMIIQFIVIVILIILNKVLLNLGGKVYRS